MSSRRPGAAAIAAAAVFSIFLSARRASAHCDTLDGPVVADARAALDAGDAGPVLKWIAPGSESEVRKALTESVAVRGLGPEAKELADRSFFETVVRLHRASEGEPFTGLKPAGTGVSPAVRAADRSLETGSADELVRLVSERNAAALRERFARAREARRHASESPEAGRAYVRAYVEYVHAAESLFATGEEPAGSLHAHER